MNLSRGQREMRYALLVAFLLAPHANSAELCRIGLKRVLQQLEETMPPPARTISGVSETSVTIAEGSLHYDWNETTGTIKMLKLDIEPGQNQNPQVYQRLYQKMVNRYPAARQVVLPNGAIKRLR